MKKALDGQIVDVQLIVDFWGWCPSVRLGRKWRSSVTHTVSIAAAATSVTNCSFRNYTDAARPLDERHELIYSAHSA